MRIALIYFCLVCLYHHYYHHQPETLALVTNSTTRAPSFRRTKNNADILSASSFSNFAPRFREIYNPVRGSRHVQPASFVPTALYRALPSVRLEISALCRLVNVETRFARFPVRRISRISSFSLSLSLSFSRLFQRGNKSSLKEDLLSRNWRDDDCQRRTIVN